MGRGCSLVLPEDEDKTVGERTGRAMADGLDRCPSWLSKATSGGLIEWLLPIIHASWKKGRLPASLLIRLLLEKPTVDP